MSRLIIIAAVTLLGSACSRTELAYRNADRLLEFYAWKTIDASATQRDDWRALLETTLQHHREKELPLVIDWLELAGRVTRETPASPGMACLVDGAGLLYRRHARLAADLAAPLLTGLDKPQVLQLGLYIAERQENAVRRYLKPDPGHRQASRRKRFIDRIEKWTGTLDQNQQQQVTDALERIPDLSAPWLSYRAQQSGILVEMLETGTNTEALQEHLENWWVYQEGQSGEYRRLWRVAREEFVQLMDGLALNLSGKQRARVERRLSELRKDLASFVSPTQRTFHLQALPACADLPA